MVKNEVAAWLVMEQTMDPVKPKNVKVFDKNSLFYLSFETTLQSFNVRNRNGREYLGEAMIPSLNAEHIMELQSKKSWFGEAGHPMSGDVKRILTIDPQLTSHRIARHSVDTRFCKGTIETLDDGGYGRKMTRLILQGMEPAFSLRALAPLSKKGDGTSVVRTKAHVVTYDWVILPSHKDAYRDESKPVEKIIKQICDDGNSVQECTLLPVQEAMIKDFISMESTTVKMISNVCEVAMDSMQLSHDMKNVILKEHGLTYIVPIEEKIKHDVSRFMLNL